MKLYMRTLSALVATIMASTTANAGIYVSADSISSPTQHQLAVSQLEHMNASTKAIERAIMSNEYMMGATIELNKEIQARAEQRLEQVYEQRLELDQAKVALIDDQNLLINDKKNLELRRMQLESDYQNKNHALMARNAATQAAIYQEQNDRHDSWLREQQAERDEFYQEQQVQREAFRKEQSEIQGETLSLQKSVAKSQDELLVAQLQNNSPSNVVVLSSKEARNVQANVPKSYIKSFEGGVEADSKKSAPLVNMNEFVRQVIPSGWTYTPPRNSGNKQISLVQGRDWKSIITTLGVQHPYLDILIDVPNSNVRITSRQKLDTRAVEPVRAWQITRSRSLEQTIKAFGKEAGWQVIWDTQNTDYNIVANGVIHGNFSGENGVINQLMLTTQNQDFPLTARWSPNAVRIVRRESKSRK